MLPFSQIMDIKAGGRKTFVTNKGFGGLCSADAKGGDLAVILFGLREPMDLRPLETGTFRLVGDAYIDGIMQGEDFERERGSEVFALE
jgi:hypothetical protein